MPKTRTFNPTTQLHTNDKINSFICVRAVHLCITRTPRQEVIKAGSLRLLKAVLSGSGRFLAPLRFALGCLFVAVRSYYGTHSWSCANTFALRKRNVSRVWMPSCAWCHVRWCFEKFSVQVSVLENRFNCLSIMVGRMGNLVVCFAEMCSEGFSWRIRVVLPFLI